MSVIQTDRATQLLTGQQFGVEMTDSVASEEQKSEDVHRAKKKYKGSLLAALLWFIADAINWLALLDVHATGSIGVAIAFGGVFIMYAIFAYIARGEYRHLLSK